MTDLTPVSTLSPVVQLETNTLALGGTGNPMNAQAQALLNRTAFLNDALIAQGTQIDGKVSTADLAGPAGAGDVGFSADETYPTGTVGERLSKYITVTDAPFNAVADAGVTDNTAAVLAAAIAAGPRGAIYVPPMVGFSLDTLMNDVTYPTEVVLFDNSLINGGYLKDKTTGIYEKGDPTAESDTTFVISSGHNAGIFMDNTGKAAGGGGPSRNVGVTWTSGRYSVGAIPGAFRPIARAEWNGSGTHWANTKRKRAPWQAVADNYFRWSASASVNVTYVNRWCVYQNRFYFSASTGVTGTTPLTHTSGTVSDGGVDWTYFQFSYDQGFYSINDLGRIAINSALGTFFRRDRMSVDDTGDMIYGYEPVGVSKNVTMTFLPTDGAGASTGSKQLSVATTGFSYTVDGTIAGAFLNTGFNQRGLVKVSATAAALDTTPTVLGIGRLVLNNASATSITTLDDGVTNQEVELVFQTGNTTLVNSAGFKLTGSTNVTPTPDSVVTMSRAPYSAIWIEVSRSIK